MRQLVTTLAIIAAILGLILSILPFGSIALIPIITAFILGFIAFKMAQKEGANTKFVKVIFLITIIALVLSIYRSVFEKIVNLITKVNYKNEHVNKFNKIKINNLLIRSKFRSVKVIKILNIGVFFGLISFNISNSIQNILYKFNRHKSGYLLIGIIKK